MEKKLYAILALLIVGGIGLYLFFPRCQQPDEMMVAQTQLKCALLIDVPALRAEVCQQLHGTPECQLAGQEDFDAALKLVNKKIDDCAKAALQAENKCIDKYEELQ